MEARMNPPPMVPSAEERAQRLLLPSSNAVPQSTLIAWGLKAAYRDGWTAALAAQPPEPVHLGKLSEEDREAADYLVERMKALMAEGRLSDIAYEIEASLAAARAQGVREERERNVKVRHAAGAFLAITETANLTEAITRDKLAWGLRHHLRRALATPEPQEEKHDGQKARAAARSEGDE